MKTKMVLVLITIVASTLAQQYDIVVKKAHRGYERTVLRMVDVDSMIFRELPSEGLLLHYPFQANNTSTVKDFSGNEKHGVYKGSALPYYYPDRFDEKFSTVAFVADSQQYVEIPNVVSGLSAMTISVWFFMNLKDGKWRWIYGTSPTSGSSLVDVGAAVHNGKITYHFKTTTGLMRGEGTNTVDVDEWVHLIMVYNGSTVKGYLDKVSDFSRTKSGTVSCTQKHRLGYGYVPSAKEYFIGGVDDVRIFNRALTTAEIDDLYREGRW